MSSNPLSRQMEKPAAPAPEKKPISLVEASEAQLLEALLARTPKQRVNAMDLLLTERIEKVAGLLPRGLEGQAERLVKTAMVTFGRSKGLQECTPGSVLECVLQGAQFGLAIDGRLAHAVPYKKKKNVNGKWVNDGVPVAQFIPDYKGIVAVARRVGVIRDAWARIVCRNDTFRVWDDEKGAHITYEERIGDRGVLIGAYALVLPPSGDGRYEFMDLPELNRIRDRSPAYRRQKTFANPTGPWFSDTWEMYRKTVIKRVMKMYQDDPGIARLLEIDERAEEEPDAVAPPEPRPSAQRVQKIQETIETAPSETDNGELGEGELADQADSEAPSDSSSSGESEPGTTREANAQGRPLDNASTTSPAASNLAPGEIPNEPGEAAWQLYLTLRAELEATSDQKKMSALMTRAVKELRPIDPDLNDRFLDDLDQKRSGRPLRPLEGGK